MPPSSRVDPDMRLLLSVTNRSLQTASCTGSEYWRRVDNVQKCANERGEQAGPTERTARATMPSRERLIT